MPLHDIPNRGKPESGRSPGSLGRVEGLKHLIPIRAGNSGTVVLNLNADLALKIVVGSVQRYSRLNGIPNRRFLGVDQKVQESKLKLSFLRKDRRCWPEINRRADSQACPLSAAQFDHLPEDLLHICRLVFSARRRYQMHKSADGRSRPVNRQLNCHQIGQGLGTRSQIVLEQAKISHGDGERIIDLMHDPGNDLPHHQHPFHLSQPITHAQQLFFNFLFGQRLLVKPCIFQGQSHIGGYSSKEDEIRFLDRSQTIQKLQDPYHQPLAIEYR